jgi:hypothetical protein
MDDRPNDERVEDLDVPPDESDELKGGGKDYLLVIEGIKGEHSPESPAAKLPGKRTPPT